MNKIKDIFANFQNINQNIFVEIIIAIAIIIVSSIIGTIIAYAAIKIFKLNKKNQERIKENPWYYGIKTIIICSGIYLAILITDFPENVTNIVMKVFKIILILAVARIIVRFLTPKSKIFKKMKENEKINKNEPLVNFIEKIAKYIVYSVAIFMIVAELGYDLSGLIAGLGLSRSCSCFSCTRYC